MSNLLTKTHVYWKISPRNASPHSGVLVSQKSGMLVEYFRPQPFYDCLLAVNMNDYLKFTNYLFGLTK